MQLCSFPPDPDSGNRLRGPEISAQPEEADEQSLNIFPPGQKRYIFLHLMTNNNNKT